MVLKVLITSLFHDEGELVFFIFSKVLCSELYKYIIINGIMEIIINNISIDDFDVSGMYDNIFIFLYNLKGP